MSPGGVLYGFGILAAVGIAGVVAGIQDGDGGTIAFGGCWAAFWAWLVVRGFRAPPPDRQLEQ